MAVQLAAPGGCQPRWMLASPKAMHELHGQDVVAGRQIDFGLLIGCAAARSLDWRSRRALSIITWQS